MSDARPEVSAEDLMNDFVRRTGLRPDVRPDRYLWTDAFALTNLLGLWRETHRDRYMDLVRKLLEQVHGVLGRHRKDDGRSGRISGLTGEHAPAHPTIGGLRIGKPLPERGPDGPLDRREEWDRDGQYFHYLTKWVHSLDVLYRETAEGRYVVWAAELALTAGRAFLRTDSRGRRSMCWKMSIDLSRPLVPSMGSHDPLDGYVRCRQLQDSLRSPVGPEGAYASELDSALEGLADTCLGILRRRSLATPDPLGLGGLLSAAAHLYQLAGRGASADRELLGRLFRDALSGLEVWTGSGAAGAPAGSRLPFRELGLAIGLRGVSRILDGSLGDGPVFVSGAVPDALLRALGKRARLAARITAFWGREENHGPTWAEHRNINEVMLATALSPDGFLVLAKPGGGAGGVSREEF